MAGMPGPVQPNRPITGMCEYIAGDGFSDMLANLPDSSYLCSRCTR